MLNINATVQSSEKSWKRYEKMATDAKRILDRQFSAAMFDSLEASISRRHTFSLQKQALLKRKIIVRSEEDPARVLAWAVAQRVREARERQGLRQEDLANKAGIARPNIARLEKGIHIPTLTTLRKVAQALNIDINSLMAPTALTPEDKRLFAEMAETGMNEWGENLDEEDAKD